MMVGVLIGVVILALLLLMLPFMVVAKPVIYFYPESPTSVSAQLSTDEFITHSEPFVGFLSPASWRFTALPNSTLLFNGGSSSYPYLFYETSYVGRKFPLREGWSVPSGELDALLARELPRLGLSEREAGEFREYWMARLPLSPYYSVYVVERKDTDEKLALTVSPTPDSIVRVILAFKPTAQPGVVPAQPTAGCGHARQWGGFIVN